MAARAGRAWGRGEASGAEALEPRRLMVADPITSSHPSWFANYGTIVVDGILNPAEWAGSIPVTRTAANRPDESITLRMKYTQLGLYIGADIRDQYLWADGGGGGSGAKYDWFNDDSLALFFDASNTRKQFMTPAGRALAFNLGLPNGPTSGPGVVTRYNYIAGNNPRGLEGNLNGVQVNPFGNLSAGMTWKTVLNGTPNNNSDIDTGWTTEVFLPWDSIGLAQMPRNGQAMTMNFSAYFDDTGGVHDNTAHDMDTDPVMRFGPRTIDDQIDGAPSSFNVSMPGMQGPIDYAWVVFTNPNVADKPNAVNNLSVGSVDGYSAWLNFCSPAASQSVLALGVAKRGGVYQYAIRESDSPITDELSWDSATPVVNSFVPKPRGVMENLHIGQLEPGQTYYIAIRTVDGVGRLSDIRQIAFTTQDTTQDTTDGTRVMTSPGGGGLITEDGSPFVLVGSAVAPSALYVRNLYPGDVWNSGAGHYTNYTITPGGEGGADGYFDALASYGVNTLRVSLESLLVPAAGQGDLPRGMYWLEYPAGHYNPDMRTFLVNMMSEAARTGIKLILEPFDTFNFRTSFNLSAYSAVNGGPLNTINDFFQSAGVMNMVINRITTIMDWVEASPDAASVLAIDLPNEWDDWSWTLNPRGDGDPSRTQEMRDRSKVILRVAAAARAHDPSILVASSTDGLVPRGPEARALFLGDNIDILTPHWYSASTAEPVNNPAANKSILPVTDYAGLASYWMSNRRDDRAINNGEWGLVKWLWPGSRVYYTGVSPVSDPTKPWTVANDVDMYRTTSWTQIALGLAGSGIRLAGQEMRDLVPSNIGPGTTGYLPVPLPAGMREIQQTVAEFTQDFTLGFDYANYNALPLAGRVRFSGTSKKLIGVGSSDGLQGMVYVTQDLNRTAGNVAGAILAVDGLVDGNLVDVEFWSTGTNGQQLDMIWGVPVVNGRLAIALPTFNQDIMVRFKAETW